MANFMPSFWARIVLALSLFIPLIISSVVPVQAVESIIRVAEDGTEDENCGFDWTHPCDFQYALQSRAMPGDKVWVKVGTYFPTIDELNRNVSFQIKDGIEVYGGFDGTELSFLERSGLFSQTILSGDIDHETFPDAASPATDAHQIRGANSLHVVTLLGVGENTIVDGFMVNAGQADAALPDYINQNGGGILIYNGVPKLSNLLVIGNEAGYGGGGIMVWENDHDPVEWATQPILEKIYISGNKAYTGGGIAFGGAGSQMKDICGLIKNITITGNITDGYGGGVSSAWCRNLELLNVTISDNITDGYGGAMFDDSSNIVMSHVTLSGNTAIPGSEEFLTYYSQVKIYNSIIWNSNPNLFFDASESSLDLTYSDIRQSDGTVFPGEGNINNDPLLGVLGDYGGSTPTLPLLPGSPAINAADSDHCPALDQRGTASPQGSSCDMGAFETLPFTMMLSKGNAQSTPVLADFSEPLEVNVTSASGDPVDGGQVTFLQPAQGASALLSANQVTISGGKAQVSAAANAIIGNYTVSANLRGVAPVSFTLENIKGGTTISLSSLNNPSVMGQTIKLTAMLNAASPSTGAVSEGTITFFDGTTILGSGTPDENGTLYFITNDGLPVGRHNLSAVFSGSANFETSEPDTLEQTVDRAQTTVTLEAAQNPSKVGEEVTFTATVEVQSPGSGIPTGLVTFTEPASGISHDVPLIGNIATLTLRNLSAGNHTLIAKYQGDANFSDAASDELIQQVNNQRLYFPIFFANLGK